MYSEWNNKLLVGIFLLRFYSESELNNERVHFTVHLSTHMFEVRLGISFKKVDTLKAKGS